MASMMEISLLFVSLFFIHAGSDTVDFVPMLVIDRVSNDSITISWMPPDTYLAEYYNYEVMQTENYKRTEPPYSGITTKTFTINSLEPGTNYWFKVRACLINETTQCGSWSMEAEGQTSTNQGTTRQYF